jgi:two-component system, chemotaxis family, CheB/CheR fusion protein
MKKNKIKSSASQPLTKSSNTFPVVGIGASAGGLAAFKKLLRAIPENSGMAYVLVQHLDPEHESMLPELLQKVTNIPVVEIKDAIKVQPNHIYIIPSNTLLVANDGVLQLTPRPPKNKNIRNLPIDVFFTSLAEVHQSHAIGIVLSGTASDGTAGLKAIKDYGGITFAQDEESAAFTGMPHSAIQAGIVDFILPPEKIPQKIMEIRKNVAGHGDEENVPPQDEDVFKQILSLLRIRKGTDFTFYKQTTIRRRILRRMTLSKNKELSDYLKYVRENKEEQDVLYQDLLIPVTSFFRDHKTFDSLCKTVFQYIIKNKAASEPIRIWVAGCSTGEEAYTIAICLKEFLGSFPSPLGEGRPMQIFATDISEPAITKARTGIYSKSNVEGLTPQRLQEFFTKTDGSYQINKQLRDMCVFAVHDFLKDPPFGKIDLVSCRNALIYMQPYLQKKAFTTFHYALNPKGFLLLGKSETISSVPDLFVHSRDLAQRLKDAQDDKLFIRKDGPGKFMHVATQHSEQVMTNLNTSPKTDPDKSGSPDFQKTADDIMLSKYTPAGVVVNEAMDIVHFRGSTENFLAQSPGKPSHNLLKMAKHGLAFELRNILHKAKKAKTPVIKENIPVQINGSMQNISIEAILLPNGAEPHYLILFHNSNSIGNKQLAISNKKIDNKNKKNDKDLRIQQLEKELVVTHEDMRSITEDQQAANEELQSANEELMSSSEELQSLNEELETGKEELQSTNEELTIVNQELISLNDQVTKERDYSRAIVTTIFEPLLVLDYDFRIKSANKSFYKKFSITEKETIGKILFELRNRAWDIPGLREHLLKIQHEKLTSLEWEITYTFPAIGKHTICFNAQRIPKESGHQLILLAFDDITLRKEAEKIANTENLKLLLESIPLITFVLSGDGTIIYFNQFFLTYSGMSLPEAIEAGWKPLISPKELNKFNTAWKHSIATGENFSMELQLKRKSDEMYRWHICDASAVKNREGVIISWAGVATDIHEHKIKERQKDEFISIASHELKTPLTTAKAYVQMLQLSLKETNNKGLPFAKKANESINKLNSLIAELLDVSMIQNGKLDLHITTFNFNEMLAAAIEDVQLSSPGHNIIQSGKIDKPVTGDIDRLQQVVINLLTNAIKYSPEADKVFVNIAEENGEVKISVKDNGIGIHKENLGKIFQRYYRERGRNRQFQGLGIGLFISNEIIQRHNGKLWAESEPGKGSTFYFTIPYKLSQ